MLGSVFSLVVADNSLEGAPKLVVRTRAAGSTRRRVTDRVVITLMVVVCAKGKKEFGPPNLENESPEFPSLENEHLNLLFLNLYFSKIKPLF